eukprot:1077001_1
MSATGYDPEAANEWLQKVNLVQQTIQDLGTNGPNALKNADDLLSQFKRDKDESNNKEVAKQSQSAQAKKRYAFKKGDGWKNDYKLYCIKCFTEVMIDVPICPRCSHTPLITRKERRRILQERVTKLKKEYEVKEMRRKRWESYRKLHAKQEYDMTNYAEWELWEDEVDWEDYMCANYIPSENVAAQSMALDMKERAEKRGQQMKAAVRCKEEGNAHLRCGEYSLAVQSYSAAIDHRRDYKALYTNRALAFMKLGRYDKCISDCSIVIDMIEYIDEHERKSDIIFKAYLRRANAYQLVGDLKCAHSDISVAIALRPSQKDAFKLHVTIEELMRDEEMRDAIQTQILNDNALTDFDSALKLILDYFCRRSKSIKNAAANNHNKMQRRIDEWNAEKPSLLFDKLLRLISRKHEYAVRFAGETNGLYLTFKYLESELVELHGELLKMLNQKRMAMKMKVNLHCKQETLSKCCKLLIFITSYKHNKGYICGNSQLIAVIASNIFYIMSSFERYTDVLGIDSVHLCAICIGSMSSIRDYIASNATYCAMFYKNINEYLLYSPPNNNKLQILQYLFDFLEALFGAPSFIRMSVSSQMKEERHIYVAMFNHFNQYMDYVHSARMGQDEMMKFEIKQSVVSSILSAFATLFGPHQSVVAILAKDPMVKERIKVLKRHLNALNRMFIQFEQRNPMKNLGALPQGPMALQAMQAMAMSKQQTDQVLSKLLEKHQLNISQMCKVITVFMSLSHHEVMRQHLVQMEIHENLFDLLPFMRQIDYQNTKYATILSLARDHVVNYFDQMSAHPHFDAIVHKYNEECGYPPQSVFPAFWTFVTEIINRRSFSSCDTNKQKQQKKKKQQHKKKKKHKKQSTNTTTTHTKKKKSNTKKKKDKKHKKKKKHKKQSTNTTTTHNKKTKPKQTRKALVPAVKIRICQRILAHPDYRKMGPKRLCLNDPEYHGNGSNIYSWIREYESTGTIESRKKRGGRRSDTQDIELEIVKRLMNRNGNKRISNTDISDAAKDIDKNQKHCTYSSGWIFKMKERCRTGKHGAIGIEFAKLFDN